MLFFIDDMETTERVEQLCTVEEALGSLPLQSENYAGLTVNRKRNEVTSAKRILRVRLPLAGEEGEEF